jgi:hypothetical protein
MKSGQAVDERVAITRGRCSPLASPVLPRRPAGPFFVARGMTTVYEDPYLQFTLPTQVEGAGGGGHRQRTCAGLDQEPYDLVLPSSSLN